MPRQKGHLTQPADLNRFGKSEPMPATSPGPTGGLQYPDSPRGPRELWAKRRKVAEEIAQADERVSGQ